jgi:hypothetical protein
VAARGGRVVLDEVLPTGVPDGIGTATVGPFPDVTPLLAHHQGDVPFVVARVSRTGAQVETYVRGASLDEAPAEAETVKGGTFYITKVHAGGWADLRYDHTVEETWKQTGQQVAEAVVQQAHQHGARLVVMAGDVRARNAVRAALPATYDVVEVEGDVLAAGASEQGLETAVQEAVAHRVNADLDTLTDRLAMAGSAGGPGAAAPDLPHTVAALQQGQAAVVVLDPPSLRTRTLVVGPAAHDVALPGGPRTWEGDGVDAPADLALLRAAVLTDAEVELLPGAAGLPDGVAAVLRWDTGQPVGTLP